MAVVKRRAYNRCQNFRARGLLELTEVKMNDSVDLFDGQIVFVGAVSVGDDEFGLGLAKVGAGIGDDAIRAFGIGEFEPLEVAHNRVDFQSFAKWQVDGFFDISGVG